MSMLISRESMKGCSDKQTGFTLLEVVIAVAIMGTALVVLVGSVNRNLDLTIKAKNMQTASILAERIITQVELEGFPAEREDSGTFEQFPGFEWYLNVMPYNIGILGTDIRIIRVVITWNQGSESFEIFSAVSNV